MRTEFTSAELQKLIEACERDLGPADRWMLPDGYPASLSLCIIDAVYSINANYEGVVNVVRRYRGYRTVQNGEADTDGVLELMGTFAHLGGPRAWADQVQNHWLTSTRSGILKSQAVLQAAHVLANKSVWTIGDLHAAASDGQLAEIEKDWLTIQGQRSGISWGYLLILARPQEKAGATDDLIERYADAVIGVKPDRMIKRYLARAIGVREGELSNSKAGALVKAAAEVMGYGVYALDHAIWRYESDRPHQRD